MIGISFPSFIFSRKDLLVALVSSLIQFCACWLRKSIRKGSTTIPFYRHIPRFGHVQRDLISTFIVFMRTAVHRLTQDLFSHLLWTVVSLPPFFCLCFALGHYLAVFVLSLSWFGFLYFCCSIFFHSIAFFSVFLLFSHAHFPFSSFLSLFIFLFLVFFLFCFFFMFSFVCFWLIFCFQLYFLRLVHDVLVVSVVLYSFCFYLSHHFRVFLLFLSLTPIFFAFCSRWFSPRLVFSVSFSAFNLLFSLSFGFFRFFKSICSPTHCILLLQSISLFLTLFIPHPIGFEFLMLCEHVFYS